MNKHIKHLNTLWSFESAARHRSYSKAAEELFVSQAAISQQMRTLEESLNTKLFIRRGRNMLLTQNGEKLYNACRDGFTVINKGISSIENEGISGELTVTSTHAFCSLWLMPRIYKFSLKFPDINIKIMGSNSIEDMRKKHIDVAIRFSLSNTTIASDNMEIIQSGEVKAYPVCSPAFIQENKIASPKDLLNNQLIYLANEGAVTWKSWFEHMGVQGYEEHKSKTMVTSSDMALSAVLAGHGATLAATELFAGYQSTNQLVVPFDESHPVKWHRFILYDKYSAKAKRVQLFIDWLTNELAQ